MDSYVDCSFIAICIYVYSYYLLYRELSCYIVHRIKSFCNVITFIIIIIACVNDYIVIIIVSLIDR